ncbi:MAG: HepT-like ribonuclease domain-containing protein [Microcoleaceae cyanobacterium]
MSRDEQSLLDIADSIRLIMEYAINWDSFTQSVRDQDAVIRRLIVIGEATKRLSMTFREAYPDIPWKEMAGLRDIVVHDYDEIDFNRLKPVIEAKLPEVLRQIEPLLPTLPGTL